MVNRDKKGLTGQGEIVSDAAKAAAEKILAGASVRVTGAAWLRVVIPEQIIAQMGAALDRFAAEAALDDRMKRTADDLYKLSRESGYQEGFAIGRAEGSPGCACCEKTFDVKHKEPK